MRQGLGARGQGFVIDRIDRWAQPLCTALLWLAGSYFVRQLIYAWWMGRLSEVVR
jgi:hypothetical protein